MNAPVYLDYAATTPLDPEVGAAMAECLLVDGDFANPSSLHLPGRQAAARVEQARAEVAALIGAEPEAIVWTSGATEANNLAIKGAARFYARRGRHLLTVATEHKSVLGPFEALQREGYEVEYLATDGEGRVAPETLAAALREDTVLVSLMQANNETGALHDLVALAPLVKANGSLLHVDAVQGAGRIPLDVRQLPVDLVSLSAHKLYGPKGVGALYLRSRPRVRLSALLHGGDQEQRLRPGTLATHQIVGMGCAYRLAAARGAADAAHAQALQQRLWAGREALGGVLRNGPVQGAPHILNCSFVGVHGEALAAELGDALAVASGSACTAASAGTSHVLRALGRPDQLAYSSLRFSFGRYSTEQDIDYAVEKVAAGVRRLRRISPLWEAYQEGVSVATLYGSGY